MKVKKIICVALAVVVLLVMVGCSDNAIANEDGSIITYALSDLPDTGYFIRTGENFYKMYSEGIRFRGIPTEESLTKHSVWLCNKDALVPVLTSDSEIIYRDTSGVIPEEFIFESFSDQGYTVGIAFNVNAEKSSIGFYGAEYGFCPGSTAEIVLKDLESLSSYMVLEINKAALTTAMIDSNGFIPNLQQNAKYMLGTYIGTVYEEYSMLADTRYFKAVSMTQVDSGTQAPFALTKKGYAVITIPAGLAPGFYCINGQGCFWYQPTTSDTPDLSQSK